MFPSFFAVFAGTVMLGGTPATRPADTLPQLVDGNNAFAVSLYRELGKVDDENLFFSPYSLSTALAMTYAGARGVTATEMAVALHFDLPPARLHPAFKLLIADLNASGKDSPYQLSIANALWAQEGYPFREEYLNLVKNNYQATARNVDFEGQQSREQARLTINQWVADKTREKIPELIKPGILTRGTVLVLTNAIYFRGDWITPFPAKATRDQPFTLADGRKIDVPMMVNTADLNYAEFDDFRMLELPYRGGRIAMTILLPHEPGGLAGLGLTTDRLEHRMQEFKRRSVRVNLPKFKMTRAYVLKDVLTKMGMKNAFSDKADFSGMTADGRLSISNVIHQAVLDINEVGTEAAAATAVIMARTALQPREEPVDFRVDHPFLLLIRDIRTGSILFMGRVMDPRS